MTVNEQVPPRYESLSRLDWWDYKRIKVARAIVCGCGALGNEVIKNLALIGWGETILVDMDYVEAGNLSRSVLFTAESVGSPKTTAAAQGMKNTNPDCRVVGLNGRLQEEVGLDLVREADIVFGCLDNVEARLELSLLCAEADTLYLDGGLTPWEGVVSAFRPFEQDVCFSCGIGIHEMRDITLRKSCSMFAQRVQASEGVPTTPITSSVTGALMVQEGLRYLFRDTFVERWGQGLLPGQSLRYHSGKSTIDKYSLPRNFDCRYHPEKSNTRFLRFNADMKWEEFEAVIEQTLGPAVNFYFPVNLFYRDIGSVRHIKPASFAGELTDSSQWKPVSQIPLNSGWRVPEMLLSLGLPDGGRFYAFAQEEGEIKKVSVLIKPVLWDQLGLKE
ncbi:MAG: hypothetical protein GKR95_19885 [Gammaproteobacteria bacterium]|nr:hypothetical protein [Gammaproteobacteria bacterium]